MNRDVTERARAIDAAAAELKASIDELNGLGPADELAILVGALQRVSAKLAKRAEELESTVPAFASEGPRRPTPARAAPARAAHDSPAPAPADEPAGLMPTGLRIVATDLAASGSTREEVHRYLQQRFGVEEPDSLLDKIFEAERPISGAGR